MSQTNNIRAQVCALTIGLIYFAEVCLGISEAYYFNKYYDLEFDKGYCAIRGIVLGGAINDISCGSLSILYGFIAKFWNYGNNCTTINHTLQFHMFKFGYLMIVMIFYHNLLSCYGSIMQYVPEFWTFAMIHFVSGCIIVGTLIILLLTNLILKIYKKYVESRQFEHVDHMI